MEINNLKIEDIEFDNMQLKVVQGKGSKDRYVIINQNIINLLRFYIGKRTRGYVFVKTNHTQYSKRALQKKVEKVLKECNFAKKLSTHSLRHTYATLLRRNGMALDKIQILMGHSKRETTEIYAHIELEPIKQELFKMIGFM